VTARRRDVEEATRPGGRRSPKRSAKPPALLQFGLLLFGLPALAGLAPHSATQPAGNLVVRPWSKPLPFLAGLAFLPDGSALVTEKDTGRIQLIERDGTVRKKPFARLQVFSGAEYGLLGIAVDPDFKQHPYVYVYYVQATPDGKLPRRARLVRYRSRDGTGLSPRVIVDNLETNTDTIHVGGAIAFQGKHLLLAVGDAAAFRSDPRVAHAQDARSRQGKILRLTRDGKPAPGNQFGNHVFTLGHRNSYGIAVDAKTGAVFESENGPDQSRRDQSALLWAQLRLAPLPGNRRRLSGLADLHQPAMGNRLDEHARAHRPG
jgi:glucose/arabinose dehydrogenase